MLSAPSPLPCDAETFERLWRHADSWTVHKAANHDRLQAAVERAIRQLNALTSAGLHVDVEGPTSYSAYAAGDRIVIGLGYLSLLERTCRLFANYLLQNFITQNANLGPIVNLPVMVSARDFPSAALGLYEGHMLPKAKQSGSVFSALMAMSHAIPPAIVPNVVDLRQATGWLARPLPDIGQFKKRWDQEIEADKYKTRPPVAHSLLLFGRLFDSSLLFTLAHEYAHVALGHAQQPAESAERSRVDEVAADAWASAQLVSLDGFDLRAVALLFAFIADYDDNVPPETREHPFPADRMGLLVAAAGSDATLRKDLNAATRLLRRSIEAGGVEAAGMGPVRCLWSADLEGTLCIELAFGETKGDLKDLAVELQIEIRDSVHPAKVFRTGTARAPLSAAAREAVVRVVNGEERAAPRATLTLAIPPSWWIDLRQGVPAVVAVNLIRAQRIEGAVWNCEAALDTVRVLAALDAVVATDSLLAQAAARASQAADTAELAMLVTQKVCNAAATPCGELRLWLAKQHNARGEWSMAASSLERVFEIGAEIRPGARLEYAKALWNSLSKPIGLKERDSTATLKAYDFAWREAVLQLGRSLGKEATALAQSIVFAEIEQPAFQTYVAAVQVYQDAVANYQSGRAEEAYKTFLVSARALRQAFEQPGQAYYPVFSAHNIGEALMGAGAHSPESWMAAGKAYASTIDRDPGFALGHAGLAKIAMNKNDFVTANREVDKGLALLPDNDVIASTRQELWQRITARVTDLGKHVGALADSGAFTEVMNAVSSEADLLALVGAPHGWYARAAFQSGHIDLAARAIERAIAMSGEDFEFLVLRALFVLESGDALLARNLLIVALGYAAAMPTEDSLAEFAGMVVPYSWRPTRALATAAHAWACLNTGGESSAARMTIEQLLAQQGLGGMTHFYLARILAAAGDEAAATAQASAALQDRIYPLAARHVDTLRDF